MKLPQIVNFYKHKVIKEKPPKKVVFVFGSSTWARTRDLRINSVVLTRLDANRLNLTHKYAI